MVGRSIAVRFPSRRLLMAAVMARHPQTGSAISALYERTSVVDEMVNAGLISPYTFKTTLKQVVADVGLGPMAPDAEEELRYRIGVIIGYPIPRRSDS